MNLLKYLKQYWYLVTYAGVVSIVVFFFQVPIVAVILSAIVFGSIHAWLLSKKEVPHA
jgi:uncharacterized membrane protein HdeD (DUF308 family)